MTKPPFTQSQKRSQESLASLFQANAEYESDFIFLKSSSDVGVQRNGGRNGACFAPQSFLSYFKKLNTKASLAQMRFAEIEVASSSEEKADFHQAQLSQSQRIATVLKQHPQSFVCHLGGGHDHIYPLLKALGQTSKKLIVINIDAHADTRTDPEFHSGTPFRQFANEFAGEFILYQTGLLEFANSESTMSPLPKGKSHVLWKHELSDPKRLRDFLSEIKNQINPETKVIFSLDADALNGAEMPGVSAVNGNGLTRNELAHIWQLYRDLPLPHAPIVGFYELNPVYDTLSMLSMRTLGSFLFDMI